MATLIKAQPVNQQVHYYSFEGTEMTWEQNVKPAQGKKFTLGE